MSLGRVFALSAVLCATLLSAQAPKSDTEAAPGVPLPATGTMYGLDTATKGATLLQIHPEEILADSHAGSNFARSMVYSGPHSSIDIAGSNSTTTFQSSPEAFYIRLGGDEVELLRARVTLLKLKPLKDRRRVSDFSMNIFGGHRTQHYDEIAVTKADVPNTNWLKVTPQSPLEPGEYGIVFMPKDPNLFGDAVYDFSVAGDTTAQQKKK